MINILYLLFITLPVIYLSALSVTAILSFPEWSSHKSYLQGYSFWHSFHTTKNKACNYQQKETVQGLYRAREGCF